MMMDASQVADVRPGVSHPRTPVEYFWKDEGERSTLPGARTYWHQAPEQGFTFHGHRLSSLYRTLHQSDKPLRKRESICVSSFQKYSHQTPAQNEASGGRA